MNEYLNQIRKLRQQVDGEARPFVRVAGAYQPVVYSKGGYVLHMLRMMLFDPRNQNPDQHFQAMMQDFCKTFDNKAASTEDFKAIVEKHMTPAMDIEGNHRMDWFFRQYVYGMGIPQYSFHYLVEEAGEGKWKVSGSVAREAVGWLDGCLAALSPPWQRFGTLGLHHRNKATNVLPLPLAL